MKIETATAGDIPAIMEIERQPGFDNLIGRFSKGEHLRQLHDGAFTYLIFKENGHIGGLAILSQSAPTEWRLNRIAVRTPGRGSGAAFLRLVLKRVFSDPSIEIIWLNVAAHNSAARHLYETLGFRETGIILKAGRLPNGATADLVRYEIGPA